MNEVEFQEAPKEESRWKREEGEEGGRRLGRLNGNSK
jgi:hypothetical protein